MFLSDDEKKTTSSSVSSAYTSNSSRLDDYDGLEKLVT
jgi:hypothetical protein